ncbi:MAG: class I SAM-dependent methyltransferase [Terracidiphilus sp.]
MSDAPNFDRLARFYRWMEVFSFGPWLMRCRCAFLDRFDRSCHALLLGDGDGRFAALLLGINPTVRIEAVDASSAMVRALVHRAGSHAGRVRAYRADLRQWQPGDWNVDAADLLPYDLVVTHFFLDCLATEEVRTLADKLRACVAPEAIWVVSEFAVPEGLLGLLVARPVIWGLYCAFGWLTGLKLRRLPRYSDALHLAGFTLKERKWWLGGLLVSDLWFPTPTDSPHATPSGANYHS